MKKTAMKAIADALNEIIEEYGQVPNDALKHFLSEGLEREKLMLRECKLSAQAEAFKLMEIKMEAADGR